MERIVEEIYHTDRESMVKGLPSPGPSPGGRGDFGVVSPPLGMRIPVLIVEYAARIPRTPFPDESFF